MSLVSQPKKKLIIVGKKDSKKIENSHLFMCVYNNDFQVYKTEWFSQVLVVMHRLDDNISMLMSRRGGHHALERKYQLVNREYSSYVHLSTWKIIH